MSLSVDVFFREPGGGMRVLDVPAGCNDSAGFESWRHKVWGSDAVRALGARFLPRVFDEWMEVPAGELPGLLDEIALLRARLDPIAAAVEVHPTALGKRLDNIEAAARRAQELGAWVIIW